LPVQVESDSLYDELLGVLTLVSGKGYNESWTVHNLLELWKQGSSMPMGFDTSVNTWC